MGQSDLEAMAANLNLAVPRQAFATLADRHVSEAIVDAATYGDGGQDARSHIQGLIDAQEGRRATLYLPAGEYVVSGAIDLKRCNVQGAGKAPVSGGGGTTVTFADGGFYSSVRENSGFGLADLTVRGAQVSGQRLVDWSGQNFPWARNLRLDMGDTGMVLAYGDPVECNYGVFSGVDLFRCATGVAIGDAGAGANSHVFVGGRVWSCVVGADVAALVNNISFVGTAFEVGDSPNEAVRSLGTNVSFFGARFESLHVNLHVLDGAGPHWVFGCHHSSGADIVDDNTPPQTRGWSAVSPTEGQLLPAMTAGGNLAVNGACVYDTDDDGTPDGWVTGFSTIGTGLNVTVSSGDPEVNTYATLTNVGASNPRVGQLITCQPGSPLSLTLRYRTPDTGWQIRCGSSNGTSEYRVVGLAASAGGWAELRISFTPTVDAAWVTVYYNGSSPTHIDFTDLCVSHGDQPSPAYQPASLTEDGGTVFGATSFRGLVGFYGAAAVAKQTGVPVTAEGIHAALVNLGLISA